MKLQLNHIEMCTRLPGKIVKLLEDQFRFQRVGYRETPKCSQTVLQSGKTVFIVTYRKIIDFQANDESNNEFIHGEPWTTFCCDHAPGELHKSIPHIDSVFNVALCVENLAEAMDRLSSVQHRVVQKPVEVDGLRYAIVTSICGNMVHTLLEKKGWDDWFMPGFTRLNSISETEDDDATTHLDHVAVACRAGESAGILEWYEKAFGMKRFLTNRNDDLENGLVIDGDAGMRLKAMEFWKCSETGLSSSPDNDENRIFKLVVAESLPNIKNVQIEGFIHDHNGPGLQHVGLHTSNMVKTVERMRSNGVLFRQPPPTYYSEVGQLEVIKSVGEDVELLRKCGILLDNEADTFDTEGDENHNERYLMQIFTHPIFDKDTFFFEVIQRKGARGFGVGNVTALARSIIAYNLQMNQLKENNV